MSKKINIIQRSHFSRRDFLKVVSLATGAIGTTLILPGCGQQTESSKTEYTSGMVDTTGYKKDPPYVIVRSGMGEVNSWQAMATLHFDYATKEVFKDKFKEVYTASAFFDPAQQVADIEDLMTHNPDVMIITPVSGGNCVAQIEAAMDQGIPVILPGARAYTNKYISYIDRDNNAVGLMYADWVAQQIGGKGKVAIMMGLPGNTYAEDVLRGTREGLAKYPDIEEVGLVYGHWSPVDAKTEMEALLAKGTQIDGIINDGGNMAIGIIDAYLDAGLPIPPLGGDDSNGFLRKAKEHDVKFVAPYPSGNEATYDAVETAVKVLSGEPVVKNVLKEIKSFTNEGLDKYYRPDLSDQYWTVNKLSEDWIDKNFKE
ncbi:MAG TPA: substrate-binding domain-containing protein [Anaerolineae bacterium]|nr:substrate-binding domain-containing protein [Anaerolineae bacterium]